MSASAGIVSQAPPQRGWIALVLLGLIVALGAFFRFKNLTAQSFWLDEYSPLYLATGRGDLIFHLPRNAIFYPPYIGFDHAPAWWHIWNGVASTSHPPLFHMMERWWVDLFGDGDWGLRAMTSIFSLGAAVLLYLAVWWISASHWRGLAAAALMALSPGQIFYSQEVRPYTILQFFALVAALMVIWIEKKGWTYGKLIVLGFAVIALMLTHYFSAGVVGALFVYALIRLRGRTRVATLTAFMIAMLIFTAAWGPKLVSFNRSHRVDEWGKTGPDRTLFRSALSVPNRLTLQYNYDAFFQVDDGPWYAMIALAIMVYVVPILRFRTRGDLLLWWLWVIGEVGVIAAIDLARGSDLLSISRYILLAGPGVYAILASPLPTRIGTWAPAVVVFGVLAAGVAYWQIGPRPVPDMRLMSQMVNRQVHPGDVLLFMGNFYTLTNEELPEDYVALSHYHANWTTPIVFATTRLDDATQDELRKFRHVWVFGVHPQDDMNNMLPTWRIGETHGTGNGNVLWSVIPPP